MKQRETNRERGAALLMAMLTVALVTTFAAAALWQQWRSIEVETAERGRVQAEWVLTGALDWARLILREDGKPGAALVDHLGEPWAVPLEEARLSSFLAADANASADAGAEVFDAFLSGQITDLQSLLNVTSLVDANGGKLMPDAVESFARLFDLLGIPRSQLDVMTENLRFATDRSAANQSGSRAALVPQTVDQLTWLGLPPESVALLKPYVTILPRQTLVNLNTASAEVIYAVGHVPDDTVEPLSMAEAQQLVGARTRSPFRTIADASKLLEGGAKRLPQGQAGAGVGSSFFEIRARLRLDKLVVEERSLVNRDGQVVQVVRREHGAFETAAPPTPPNR